MKKSIKLWWLLGLILPPVGLILYFLWKNNKKEDAKSIGTASLISLVVWLFVLLSFLITANSVKTPNVLKEVDTTASSEIVKNWYKDLSDGNSVVTVLAGSECPYCQNLKPIIEASSQKNGYKLYFFELDLMSETDYDSISNSIVLEGFDGHIPYTFVINNKEFSGGHMGAMSEESLNEFLKHTDILKN